jgi:hypothetical protein
MANRPPGTRPALHIAACLKIVAKHRNMKSISVEGAREAIKRLASYGESDAELKADSRLREHLERSTGMDIKELATLTGRWPSV